MNTVQVQPTVYICSTTMMSSAWQVYAIAIVVCPIPSDLAQCDTELGKEGERDKHPNILGTIRLRLQKLQKKILSLRTTPKNKTVCFSRY